MSASLLWLLAGVLLCAGEVMIGPGIGIFFAGLAALCVGVIVETGAVAVDDYIVQFAWFFGLTILWAAVLWKPLKRFRTRLSHPSQQFSNIVGDTATAGEGGLHRGREGTAVWSGTIMKAELSGDATADFVPAGTRVSIVEVKGAKLIVK